MDQYRSRLVVGAVMMTVGFVSVLIMLSGLVISDRPPQWFWALLLLIGLGSGVIASAFWTAARDRRRRTVELLAPDSGTSGRR